MILTDLRSTRTNWVGAARALFISFTLLTPLARPAVAQNHALAAIDSLVAAEEYAAARTRLNEWWAANGTQLEADPALRARALFLRARLQSDPALARDDYLALALGSPNAPEAPAALLYLGQGLLAAGEYQQAMRYLERLLRDYPRNPLHATARLWLVRARLAAGEPHTACAMARQGSAESPDHILGALFDAAVQESCNGAAPSRNAALPEQATRSGESAANGRQEPGRAPFTLQVGAFRAPAGANALANRLRAAGHEPRIVSLPGSSLWRVRVGSFPTASAAAQLARVLRQAGFDVLIVDDAHLERPLP